MPEPANLSQQPKSTASPAPAGRASSAPESAPGLALPNLRHGNMTPADVIQLQRAGGNQAVLQLFRDRASAASRSKAPIQRQGIRASNLFQSTGAPSSAASAVPSTVASTVPASATPASATPASATPASAIPASATSASATPASATPASAEPTSIPTPKIPSNLQGKGGYSEVYGWLKEQARASKKVDLFSFFDSLNPEQKMGAIRAMAGKARNITVDAVKKTMLTGIISKSVDWDKFSEISRQAKKMDTTNYNADQDRDYASYAAIGTSSTAGGVSGSATISQTLGAGGATGTALASAPIAAGLSGVASVSQIYNATQNYDGALSAGGKAQLVAGEGAGGIADLARFSAGSVNSVPGGCRHGSERRRYRRGGRRRDRGRRGIHGRRCRRVYRERPQREEARQA
ncbi:hypothetical protein RB620_29670 [Paenibacillus sp. LHD-117]|uniref:hypothetical protein n=1 Tax=Paenibacillus sp. LHD-117 TaxID=3071412 RepID=UPI0027DFDA33|nr:hypothetical protein [Paenibacillus sp. LHD-117]MDQ6423586.1 hypothetical protein [Paenibacillus sp. LHD-117]